MVSNKTGIVMEINRNIAYIMTSSGEFTKIKIDRNRPIPTIGAQYSGVCIQSVLPNSSFLGYAIAACFALIIFLTGGTAYTYYKPMSTITVSINPAVELKSNFWSKVIYANPLNEDGTKILKEISVKNIHIDRALTMILEQAKKDNFIDENYKKDNKTINVNISGKAVELPTFKKEVQKNNLNTIIENNGTKVYNNSTKKVEAKSSSTDNQENETYKLKTSTSNNTYDTDDNSVNKFNLPNKVNDSSATDKSNKNNPKVTSSEKSNSNNNFKNNTYDKDMLKKNSSNNKDKDFRKYEYIYKEKKKKSKSSEEKSEIKHYKDNSNIRDNSSEKRNIN